MQQAFRFTLIVFILSGLIYPLAITGLGQALFPAQANGSLIRDDQGGIIGSNLVGQDFMRPEYFQPRPSANSYDAANSGGSNYGVTNKKLVERTVSDAHTYQRDNNPSQGIPIDAVTASGSGLDPHISLANALSQTPRVATARNLNPEAIRQLVHKLQEHPLFSEAPYVNVLQLNRALDAQTGRG